MPFPFPTGGYADVMQYFENNADDNNACQLSATETAYSIYAQNDYMHCVAAYYVAEAAFSGLQISAALGGLAALMYAL